MSTRVTNAMVLEALVAIGKRIDALESAQVSVPAEVKTVVEKVEKATKPVQFQGVLSKMGKSGQDLVVAAVIEREWTWVSMSEAPNSELSDLIRGTADNPKGGNFKRSRMAWAFKYHLTEADFVKLCGKFGKKYTAR